MCIDSNTLGWKNKERGDREDGKEGAKRHILLTRKAEEERLIQHQKNMTSKKIHALFRGLSLENQGADSKGSSGESHYMCQRNNNLKFSQKQHFKSKNCHAEALQRKTKSRFQRLLKLCFLRVKVALEQLSSSIPQNQCPNGLKLPLEKYVQKE